MSQNDLVELRDLVQWGDRAMARQRLLAHVQATGSNTAGEVWWLLGQTLDDPSQRADCNARAERAGFRANAPIEAAPTLSPSSVPAPATQAYSQVEIDFVVRELGRDVDRYETVKATMIRFERPYEDAEQLVQYVQANHQRAIAARQLPLILAISIGALLVSCVLGGWSLAQLFGGTSGTNIIRAGMRLIAALVIGGGALWGIVTGVYGLKAK